MTTKDEIIAAVEALEGLLGEDMSCLEPWADEINTLWRLTQEAKEQPESVWLAWWRNGLDYDQEDYLIGVYTNKDRAESDAEVYHRVRKPMGDYKKSHFWAQEVSLDLPIALIIDQSGKVIQTKKENDE